ncbi:carboxypeptidase-like regulatory domain-containing protein [Sanyastnella coralliicola]|uniref:carboxypeptidase-like regulatory domain-containing protein n=1 Tax=Sanyastnella coralliicola TaxID=3069118 RepID=UPI0027B8AF2C|nr:carboxypeptidase-like regulatory domain-containing protein [Longitalea sp. SCSIO 12813]
MRLFAILFVLLGGSLSLSAQTSKVTGTISDQSTHETLIQATVIFEPQNGDPIGVLTDFDGRYSTELAYGKYTMKVNYVGYASYIREVEINRPSKELNVDLKTIILKEATVTADLVDRETPVAFSDVKPIQIQEELASQPLPMILNSTPGVYATQEGSDDNGPSVTIRGFKQRNVSVMIDGIPVNDMENGGVFWNNWFGLDVVTQTMQVQRGLGASKLALPAIGGTINILTQGINNKRNTMVKAEGSTTDLYRVTLGHTSGRLDGGWGYTLAGSYQQNRGWIDQGGSRAWFYYVKLQKELGDHIISISAMGAPSENNRRSYQQRIATYDKEYARGLFTGTDAEYAQMQDYSVRYWTIKNDQLNLAEEEQAIADLNAEYGYDSVDDFELLMNQTDFIDTTNIIEKGPRYNVHWGMLATDANRENFQPKIERVNRYHKPLFSLRHSWNVSDKFFISNNLYASFGRGGGTSLSPGLGDGDFNAAGQVDFQRFYDAHTQPNIFGGPPSPQAGWILRKGFNNHYWYGLLSTFNYEIDNRWNLSGGIDLRDYQGEHYAEVHDLLGAEYWIDNNGDANTLPEERYEGDRIGYYYDSFVRWGGVFGLLEYKDRLWTAFLNVSGVYQGYNRVDYFAPQDVVVDDIVYYQQLSVQDAFVLNNDNGDFFVVDDDDANPLMGGTDSQWVVGGDTLNNATVVYHNGDGTRTSRSDWKWLPGYTVKMGGNYNLNEWNSAFMNVGHLNRTPVLQNVIGFDNQFVKNTANEIINSIELGYKYSKFPFTLNVNGYFTDWNNRPLDELLRVVIEDSQGVERILQANITSMSAVHMGVEVDGAYQINDMFTVEGFVSLGDWKWDSSEDELTLIDVETNRPFVDAEGEVVTVSYNAQGVSVGDAPQTMIGGAMKMQKKGFYVKPRFTWFARHFADFDPFSLNGENEGRQSWEIPAYGLLDLHAGYTFKVKDSQIDVRLSGFNLLNTLYIINAQNNDVFPFYLYRGQNGSYDDQLRYNFSESNFDASSASVYMGYGARGNLSIRVRF